VLAVAPRVNALTTSREALRIQAEHRMEVPPLSLREASELFLQRARAVRHELDIDHDDESAIERICARLDGLPLALELAAARIAVFAPRALEARIGERLALPTAPHDLPERHRTLTATIDWSYRLLEPPDRELLQALAPFIGGVRIDSAESIWGSESIESLISLSEKSLLRRREDSDGEPRFWMLETVRAFALEQAEASGNATAAAGAHADHFFSLVAQAEPHLVSTDQGRWLDLLEAEHPNLRSALDHLTAHNPQRALRMAGIMTWLWDIRGYMPEGRRRLNDVLAAAPRECPERAIALWGAGRLAMLAGDAAEAVPLLRESAGRARAAGDARMAANALANLIGAAQMLRDEALMNTAGEEAIAVARSAADDWALATALNNRADVFIATGEFASAKELLEESLTIRRRSGESRAIALTLANLAQVTLALGDLERTDSLVAEGLAHARAINCRGMIVQLLGLGALSSLQRGEIQRSEAQLAGTADQIGSGMMDPEMAAIFFAAAATVAAIRHEPLTAATLWAAAAGARNQVRRAENPAATALRARWLPEAREAVPAQTSWDSAWQTGTEMALEEAFAVAVRLATV
jgi:predicted ATPase